MDEAVAASLHSDRTVDITTTGRTSGESHRIEIWIHHLDGRHYITGIPGRRGWYANLVAHPRFVLHLKETAQADLPAGARAITESGERREVLERILPAVGREDQLGEWLAGAPLVEVEIELTTAV